MYEGRKRYSSSSLALGAHIAGHNTGNIGVAVLGNYMTVSLTTRQQSLLEDTLAWLCYRYGISPSQIYGHRDMEANYCPGDTIYAKLPEIRTNVALKLYPEINP